MTLISYAQNFEDVILWRALKHVERGFYIDIGAQDPVTHSVSLAFYEKGWRGVHVEPSAEYAEKLRRARPDEEVLRVAVAAAEGEMTFFEVVGTGLSTGEETVARIHERKGYSLRRVTVPCRPLSSILDACGERDIHWLKIDVEGMEQVVIHSWPPSKVRPWIVAVESTWPSSPAPSHSGWEPELLQLGYEFVYFDGLNRFYVSGHRPELKGSFGAGPNFFDGYELNELRVERAGRAEVERKLKAEQAARVASDQELRAERVARAAADDQVSQERQARLAAEQRLGAALSSTEQELRAERVARAAADDQVSQERQARLAAEQRLADVLLSRSWRITMPYRAVGTATRWVLRSRSWWRNRKPDVAQVPLARRSVAAAIRYAGSSERVRRTLKGLIQHHPALEQRLRGMVGDANGAALQGLHAKSAGAHLIDEPESVRWVYSQLTRPASRANADGPGAT